MSAISKYPFSFAQLAKSGILTSVSVVHAILTNRGKAMHLIQKRLSDCMGEGRLSWDEPEHIKRVIPPSVRYLRIQVPRY